MKTSELLRKAADEIRRRGWHQGTYAAEGGTLENCAVCSVGALAAAHSGNPLMLAGDEEVPRDVTAAMVRLSSLVADDPWSMALVSWNDAEGRTVEEVLDAFERAAVAAELEEK